MKQRVSLYTIFLLLTIFSFCPNVFATGAPINIEADHMTSLEEENSVLFSGNVDARQAEVRILSDKLTVYYTKVARGEKQEVRRLRCEGNVEITKGDWLGTGKTMNYLAKDRKVILSGDAKAWQGTNLVTGNTIIYYLDEGRSEVIGEKPTATATNATTPTQSGRVKATLTPQ